MPTMHEMMIRMPEVADQEKIKNTNATIQFDFSGEEPGQYVLRVQNGEVAVEPGTAENADATIMAPSELWKGIARGEVNPMQAFMTGKFKAQGNMALLMQMQSWFNPIG